MNITDLILLAILSCILLLSLGIALIIKKIKELKELIEKTIT